MTHQNASARPQRMSRPRRALLLNLEAHPTFRSAQQIHASLEESGESGSLATIYRNLQLLEESGTVDSLLSPNGEVLYRSCAGKSHHHHLICANCGRTEEVNLEGMEAAIEQLASDKGYRLLNHTLELVGLCPECAKG